MEYAKAILEGYTKTQICKSLDLDAEGIFFIPEGVHRYVEWVKK
jgi:hypothetical protein